MTKPAPALAPEKERRLQIIIWAAFLAVPPMYYVLMRKVTPASPLNDLNLVLALNVFAIVLVGISFLARRRLNARLSAKSSAQSRRVAQLVPLALCDAAALMGVVAWFTTASVLSYYPLLFGFGGIGLHFPLPPAED